MLHASIDLLFFAARCLIVLLMLLLLLGGVLGLIARQRTVSRPGFCLTRLNDRFRGIRHQMLEEMLPKADFRAHLKKQKKILKAQSDKAHPTLFVLSFQGDIRASAVCSLREEVTAILTAARPGDEVLLKLESPGGMVHAYGLATAQLQRLRDRHIPLTIVVDKIAASGGYMMACIANHLIAAPFAMVGSIGVILQLPNFNRVLKEHHVDFEQISAGRFKRTLSLFGPNTEEGREKTREEIEAIHTLFQSLVHQYRRNVDIEKVTTGEHWTGAEALSLKLVDALGTSDDFLLSRSDTMQLLEIRFHPKKSLGEKIMSAKNRMRMVFERNLLA